MDLEEQPVFLVGTGRSGTTIIYSCLAMHPSFAWVSSWVGIAPRLPMAFFNRFWNIPGTDRFRETRFFPRPSEPMRVFPKHMALYRSELVNSETLADARENLVPLITRIRKLQGKPRFLTKMAGRPVKSELFAAVFPSAFIVHITRELKPTVASLMQVGFYDAAGGLDPWPWGSIPESYRAFYRQSGEAPEVAAAIKVRLNRTEQDRQLRAARSDRWMELPYAQFVADPIESIRAIGRRADFGVDERFVKRIESRRIYGGADSKWKKYFTDKQIRNLEDFEKLPEIDPFLPSRI